MAVLARSIDVGHRVAGAGKEEYGRNHVFVVCCEYVSNTAWGEISGCDFRDLRGLASLRWGNVGSCYSCDS